MSSVHWNHLPDPCLLAIFKHFTLIELFCIIRLVCPRWSLVAPSELSQRHALVIAAWYMLDLYLVHKLSPSILLNHIRYEDDSQFPLVKYRPIDDDRAIVKSGEKILFNEQFVKVLEKNLPNITNLTLVPSFVYRSECTLQQLIRILTNWKNNLISLDLSMNYYIEKDEHEVKPNLETFFNSINQLESLKHLTFKLDFSIEDRRSVVMPKASLTILSQLETFNFSVSSLHDFRRYMLNHFESENNHISEYCEIGYEARYWKDEQGPLELDRLAKFDTNFAGKFVTLSIVGELGFESHKNLLSICSKFPSLKILDFSMDGTILVSMLAQCLSQLPQLIHFKLRIKSYQIPKEDTPVFKIAQVPSVCLLTLYIKTRSHIETIRLHIAQIFTNLQILQLWHSSKMCLDCDYDYHKTHGNHFCDDNLKYSQGDLDRVIKREDQIRIAQCMHKAKEPFRECVQLLTVEFNDGPFSYLNRKLVSRDQYFSEPDEILPILINNISK